MVSLPCPDWATLPRKPAGDSWGCGPRAPPTRVSEAQGDRDSSRGHVLQLSDLQCFVLFLFFSFKMTGRFTLLHPDK